MSARRAAVLLLALTAACGGERAPTGSATGGTLLIGTGAVADAVLPPLIQSLPGKQLVDALFLPLAWPADELTLVGDAGYTPALADRWTWSADSLSIAFHLDPRARWQDGHPVTPEDARAALVAFKSPAVGAIAAPNLANIDSIAVRDSATLVAWFHERAPTQFYDLVTNLVPIPAHVYGAIPAESLATSAVARTPVGNGKWRLVKWTPGERVEIVADTAHWLGRPTLDRIAWIAITDPIAQATKLVTGEIDMVEVLRGPPLETAAKDSSIRLVTTPGLSHAITVFNTRDASNPARPHPIFGDAGVRRALSLAIDRPQVVRSILDTLGTTMSSPWITLIKLDAPLLPHDSAHAAALLDSLGWKDTTGDGVRDKGGRALAFSLGAPVTSTPRVRASQIMQQVWTGLGAKVTLEHVESGVQMSNAHAGKFDATIMGYSGDLAPGAIRQDWHTQVGGEGSNYGHYSNAAFDAIIDSAASNLDPVASRAQYARAGAVLANDAPGLWLYEIKTVSGIHKRFRTAAMPPWGWWVHLDQWSVDPARMIDRDRIGVGTPK